MGIDFPAQNMDAGKKTDLEGGDEVGKEATGDEEEPKETEEPVQKGDNEQNVDSEQNDRNKDSEQNKDRNVNSEQKDRKKDSEQKDRKKDSEQNEVQNKDSEQNEVRNEDSEQNEVRNEDSEQNEVRNEDSEQNEDPIKDSEQNEDPIKDSEQSEDPIRDSEQNEDPIRDSEQNEDPIRDSDQKDSDKKDDLNKHGKENVQKFNGIGNENSSNEEENMESEPFVNCEKSNDVEMIDKENSESTMDCVISECDVLITESDRNNLKNSETNSEVASPSVPNSVASTDLNSDSESSSSKTESRPITTSALLRAYRPQPKTATTRSSNRLQSAATKNKAARTSTPPSVDKKKIPDIIDVSAIAVVNDVTPSLVMECKTETLSFAQVNKIQKLQGDLSKLQLLLWNGAQQGDKNGGAPPLMNGTLGGNSGSMPPLTNGTSLVGLQVPQFLLVQNGQMIGASTIGTQNNHTVTTSTSSLSNQTISPSNSYKSGPLSKKDAGPAVSTRQSRYRSAKNTANVSIATGRTSPDIEVLREMRAPGPHAQTPSSGAATTSPSSSSTSSNPPVVVQKGFPLLSIICRPKNTLPPSVAMSQRKELDGKVKSVLVKTAQEFVEWLLSEGLIRTSQFCSLHKLQPSQMPFKLKLGMFSDPKVLSTSGGYVWISECCGKKYVSVYSGSIFGSTPIDKVAPTAVLKLVYHWSCQTSIANVESWVKVDKTFVNKIYNYLRCVCSVMLQDKVYDFGFDGTTVELGIVSLGTSTADGTKKAVKVEILGLYDRKMRSYRLFASEPEPGSSSRQRFVRILKPLERVVHTNAILLCDQSVDRNCLYNMNYGKVSVCETSDNEDNLQSNAKIMSYLRRHVPKMFQSTLSQLTLQQVQIVLDELCWRERFGHCAAQAYTTMAEHITYLTARESENPGVLHLLDYVAQKPHHNWRYKSQHVPKVLPALQPSIIMSTPTAGTINPQVTMDLPTNAQSPLDHTNKVALTPRSRGSAARDMSQVVPMKTPLPVPVKPFNTTPTPPAVTTPKPDAVELEPFYYGQIQGDSSLGREINNYTYTCHLCNDSFNHNIDFYTHLKGHLGRRTASQGFCCDYCSEHFESSDSKDYHQKFRHLQMDTRYTWCRICTESFPGEFQLVNHMAKKHYESELPYRCEVCNFTTSIYFSVINHFKVEHKGSPYVQCHYCLTVKTINSSSASSFSFRMLQHLQKHTSQQGKCKSCVLSFYSKYLLDEHKRKDHVSRTNVSGLQRYKVPAGHNRIMFRPWVKRAAAPTNQMVTLTASSTVAISTTLQRLDSLTVRVDEEDENKYYCIECDGSITLDQHFKAYQKCTKCAYSTCCRSMVSKHAQVFHPNGKQKSGYYRIGPAIVLPEPMYCICGFSTRSGNHLARHLALCEGGRKSAYPSMLDAMVYRGDPMTPSALALSTLGLSRMLPGSVTPILPAPEAIVEQPEIDMSHFMSMSMDVEDEDDPPMMPVSVELGGE